MRAWSKQGFLNDASSDDSGWYKFYIKPRGKKSIGFEIVYYIADCTRRISLNFEPSFVSLGADGELSGPRDAEYAKQTRAEIARMRTKVRKWAAAVAASAEKLEQAYDEYDQQLADAIERYNTRED